MLPTEILLNAAVNKSTAIDNMNRELGLFYALVPLVREDNRIGFGRTEGVHNITPKIPYFITTPNDPPRSIIYEFPESAVRGSIIFNEELK